MCVCVCVCMCACVCVKLSPFSPSLSSCEQNTYILSCVRATNEDSNSIQIWDCRESDPSKVGVLTSVVIIFLIFYK